MRQKGFSLIELMIVVAIIGILAAIATPAYEKYILKSRTADLLTASHLGQLIVAEYIQSTGATDCYNMDSANPGSTVEIPISSENIRSAFIDAANANGYGPCTIIVQGNSALISSVDADQLRLTPTVQLAALVGGSSGGTSAPSYLELYSIPRFNTDSSISWTMYSNGNSAAPASIPVLKTAVRSGGGGTTCDPITNLNCPPPAAK